LINETEKTQEVIGLIERPLGQKDHTFSSLHFCYKICLDTKPVLTSFQPENH